MDFEELKVIWDSQNDQPLYALSESALHSIVRRRNDEIHRRAARCQAVEILGGLGFGAAMFALAWMLAFADPAWLASFSWIRRPVAPWHAAAMFLGGVLMFFYAARMYGARRRQLQREEDLAVSLRGDLDRAVAHVDFQIRIARSILWWGLVPQWIATGLWIVVQFDLLGARLQHYALILAVMAGGLAALIACQHRAIRRRYEPRRIELESLRTKLVRPQA